MTGDRHEIVAALPAAYRAASRIMESIAAEHVAALPAGTPTIDVSHRAIARAMSAKLSDVTIDEALDVGALVIARSDGYRVACRVRESKPLAMAPSRFLTQLAPLGSMWAQELEVSHG